jgi:hypothetical protein
LDKKIRVEERGKKKENQKKRHETSMTTTTRTRREKPKSIVEGKTEGNKLILTCRGRECGR